MVKIPRSPGIYHLDGRPGMGKSLTFSRLTLKLINSYYKTERRYPQLPKRELASNLLYSEFFEKLELRKNIQGVPLPDFQKKHLYYWDKPEEIAKVRNTDIIWDEIHRHVRAKKNGDMPDELLEMFSYARKRGNRIFSNSQDYKAVDINYRRMCTKTFSVEKLVGSPDISVSLPPVRFIWGVCGVWEFHPDVSEEQVKGGNFERRNYLSYRPFLIRRKYVDLYDTAKEINTVGERFMRHMTYRCLTCGRVHETHDMLK